MHSMNTVAHSFDTSPPLSITLTSFSPRLAKYNAQRAAKVRERSGGRESNVRAASRALTWNDSFRLPSTPKCLRLTSHWPVLELDSLEVSCSTAEEPLLSAGGCINTCMSGFHS